MNKTIANYLFYIFDRLQKRQVTSCLKQLEKTQWLKKDKLQELKLKKLKALLKHAYDNVPYYHESFRKANFNPNDFKGMNDLEKIPILKRKKLRENANKMVAKNVPRNRLVTWSTSGTTSSSITFFRDLMDISWGVGAELRGHSWAGYNLGDKIARIWRHKPKELNSFPFLLKRLFNVERTYNLAKLSEKTMREFAKELKKFKPEFIKGYATATNIFANFLLRNDNFKIRPKAVFTTSATLFPHYRKSIESVFDCKVYDYYACNETSHIAAQCNESENMHVSEENVILEVVDGSKHAAKGQDGHFLLTSFNSYVMPFIRYDIGDSGKLLDDECSCGRELSLVKVVGRKYEYFLNSDGSFTRLKDIQTVFEGLPIQDFQVVQEASDDIVIKILPKSEFTSDHADFIVEKIRGSPAKVRVELVDSIPLGFSGKIQRVVRSDSEYDYFER